MRSEARATGVSKGRNGVIGSAGRRYCYEPRIETRGLWESGRVREEALGKDVDSSDAAAGRWPLFHG